ncbi:MAG: alpha/beta fold hydrolase [Gammaproteobacteria bacterium]|nr:alpha/beta fold hydrolase [Gammaproteobacteria bacterium]MCP5423703.1 alpha/beta fold hydrolase [Gammaproteobacteria bacterium]
MRDLDTQTTFHSASDRMLRAFIGRLTLGISPVALAQAYQDWVLHMAMSPGLQWELSQKTFRKLAQLAVYASRSALDPKTEPYVKPLPGDNRFRDPEWQSWPFNLYYQSFLLGQQWWHTATTALRGPSRHHKNMTWFMAKQLLDFGSPSNFPWSNPVILKRTQEQGGMNLLRGLQNWMEDMERQIANERPAGAEQYQVGKNIAITPGKVVYRNRLIELLQYEPSTPQVQAEPVLIVPAWIMKYYILDLSPHNSMVKYLVDHGHTVFMISWKNPQAEDHDLGMEEYLRLGLGDALNAVSAIVPERRIHSVGYCLGGTLLAIMAAAMGRDNDLRLQSMTLFAAQTDFSEAGELRLFIDESQLSFLEDIMWDKGYLDTTQMAGAFQLLRSYDLIWSRMVSEYLLGDRAPMNDLMAWNSDATRMPYKMHKEYLRRLFLNNALANGCYRVGDRPVALSHIRVPIFAVATEQDHVAPWHSVHKLLLQADSEVTFLLTNGGHNAGVVNEPGHPHRHYRISVTHDGAGYLDPEAWLERTPIQEGSWWPAWHDWLSQQSSGPSAPPPLGNPERGYVPLENAPGTYVLQP